jgi:hypothetical protein
MNQLRLFLTDIKVSPHCVSQIGVLIKQSKKVVSAIKAATSPARNYWDTFGALLTAAKLVAYHSGMRPSTACTAHPLHAEKRCVPHGFALVP